MCALALTGTPLAARETAPPSGQAPGDLTEKPYVVLFEQPAELNIPAHSLQAYRKEAER